MNTENPRAMEFASTPGIYVLAPEANKGHVADQLSWKADQLAALLQACIGEGFEPFNCMSPDLKENYLTACSSAAEEIKALARHI